MHGWAAAHGAVFEDVGLWKRARYFPRGAEDMHAAVARECLAVRSGCGIFDASTLGKIEVVGADAVTFMNRLYVNAWDSLGVGRCRYGVLLRDDGFVYDDGVVARVAEQRFHVTTTTGGAAAGAGDDGGLPADRVVGAVGVAHLDDRAVGGHRRAGTECARGARAARRHRSSVRPRCRTCRCAPAASAACRCGCSA